MASGTPPPSIRTALQTPPAGGSTEIHRGRWQIVVEARRGGLAVLAHDGQRAERFFLGVPDGARLEVVLRTPRHPVQVRLAEIVTLAPGARLRGYVRVPLSVVITAQGAPTDGGAAASANGAVELVELLPQGFKTAWIGDGERGCYVDQVASPFMLDARDAAGEADVVVPVVLRNVTQRAVSPALLTLRLHTPELRGLRGGWIAAPRRLRFDGNGRGQGTGGHEQVRPFLESGS